MQEFHSSVEINSEVGDVFRLAKDIYSCPEFIPDLKSVKVLERSDDGSRIVSEWAGIVREFRVAIRWTAEDVWDEEANTCTFSVTKGDFGRYAGSFTFTDLGGSTRLDGQVTAECDVRRFGASIERFVAKKMKKNVDSMFDAIRTKAERDRQSEPVPALADAQL